MCMGGVVVGFSMSIPSLVRKLAISFLVMPEYAHTLYKRTVCGIQFICIQWLL